MKEHYWIVIAWVTMDGIRPTGRTVRRDGYDRPEFEAAPLAKACTWTKGSTDPLDLTKAKAYAAEKGAIVCTYAESEHTPLGAARGAALTAVSKGKLKIIDHRNAP